MSSDTSSRAGQPPADNPSAADKKQCSKPAPSSADVDIDLKDPAVNDAASKIQLAFRKHQDHKGTQPK
uniref:Uncharacterized protein n=1 Tax=Plectus sambesii TaxID=2011161 RepID=A0A914WYA6_9BILA